MPKTNEMANRAALVARIVERAEQTRWVVQPSMPLQLSFVSPDALLHAIVTLDFAGGATAFPSVDIALYRVALDGTPTYEDATRAMHDLFGAHSSGFIGVSGMAHRCPRPAAPYLSITVAITVPEDA